MVAGACAGRMSGTTIGRGLRALRAGGVGVFAARNRLVSRGVVGPGMCVSFLP